MQAADLAWMLVATAMVLVMTPALGFFYGGMVRAKNALNTIMMSMMNMSTATTIMIMPNVTPVRTPAIR